MTATARRLPDGRRLHLQHGPIDLIVEAWGAARAVAAAYERAAARFPAILPALVSELRILRTPLPHSRLRGDDETGRVRGPVARRMVAACWPYRRDFITPMAAVAGAVADAVLATLVEADDLDRAYVNNGGDIAFHLAPGERLTAGVVADVAQPALHGTIALDHAMTTRGLATSGAGGRSFSLGIADAVTVLARTAAEADAAATMVANAVDVDHPAIQRAPASSLRDDSDLGDRRVTVAVGALPAAAIETALARGGREAERLIVAGLIHGAVLVLKGVTTVVVPHTLPTLAPMVDASTAVMPGLVPGIHVFGATHV
ncbi:MAG TPA: hypothetical protein VMB81_16765 [Candidatus Sulfotelmatobacter sp.]|nr:hypothetical protein [Candidatus Sulfotelmatobacter sp.]